MVSVALALLTVLAGSLDAAQVAPGVHLIPGVFTPGTQPDGNTVVLRAPGGLVVVDTGRHAEHTGQIIEFADREKQRVAAIVNTHWHLDHVGGNLLLRQRFPGVRVYASDAISEARTGFLASYKKQLEEALSATSDPEKQKGLAAEVRLIDQGARLEPDEVIARAGRRTMAGLPLDIGLETRAVTAGDVWLFEPRSRVLVAGDLVTLPAPFLDTACPARWAEALDHLSRVDFKLLVPGHGRPMERADFETYRTAFTRLIACGASDKPKEQCITGWIADAGRLVPGSDHTFTRVLMDYYVGVLRGDPVRVKRLCGQ